MSESATQASGSRALLAALAGACLLQQLVSRAAMSCLLRRALISQLTSSFAVALVLAAGALVPSELVRILSSRDVRRRVFEPRLARRGVWGGVVREAGLWPLAWAVTAWSIDDTDQEVVDGAPAAAAVARKACAHLAACRSVATRAWPRRRRVHRHRAAGAAHHTGHRVVGFGAAQRAHGSRQTRFHV